MAKPKPGMGRGLEAILSVSRGAPRREEELRELPVELIVAQPQPAAPALRRGGAERAGGVARRAGRAAAGARAAQAGRHVRAGRRRAPLAGGADRGPETIPALVRPRDDAATLELALIENMAREDLNPIEEARACAALVEELGLTREEVGRRVGRSRVAVSNLVRLLDLPDEAIELLRGGALSEGHGRALLLAEDHGARRRLARDGGSRGLVGAHGRRARPGAATPGQSDRARARGRATARGAPRPGAGGARDRRRRSGRRSAPRCGCEPTRRRLPRGAVVRSPEEALELAAAALHRRREVGAPNGGR